MIVDRARGWSLLASLLLVACDGGGSSTSSTTESAGGSGATTAQGGSGGSTTGGAGGQGGSGAQGGSGGSAGASPIGDPVVFRTPDVNAVCGPTPPDPCTPSDMAWITDEYGTTYQRADEQAAGAAGQVYRLVELSEREGPSNIDVYVVDPAGAPLAGLPVAFYYSSAPEPSRPDEWYPVKVLASTGPDGRAGFAIAASAYIPACGAGGPHAIWVSVPGAVENTTIPSDLADKLGMLGGTNHRHLDLLFQRVDIPGNTVDAVHCPL